MAEKTKIYHIPLKQDLSGWKSAKVTAMTVIKFGQGKPAQLKEEFEVTDDPASPIPGIDKGFLEIFGKEILPTKDGVQFFVTVPANADLKQLEGIECFLLQVVVKLDIAPLTGAVGGVMGAMGMGMAGMAGVPQEAGMLAATCRVKVQVPEYKLTIRKFRWEELKEVDLKEYVSSEEIAQLYARGGELWIPVKAKSEQTAAKATISLETGIAVCDVAGELNWMGTVIKGSYREDEDPGREYIVFQIPGTGSEGAPDLAPGSPTGGLENGNEYA